MPNSQTYVEQLIDLYKAAQMELIIKICDTEARGSVASYQKAILTQISREIEILTSKAIPLAEELVKTSYLEGIKAVNKKLKVDVNAKDDIEFLNSLSKTHRKTINVFIRNLHGDLNDVHYFVGRQIRDTIHKAGMDAVGLKLSANETVQECKNNIVRNLAENGVKAIKTKNGYMRLDSYGELTAISTTRECTNSACMLQIQELGYDLVKMSSHRGACPLCQEYQGRVYSISGKDTRFPKLDIAFSSGYANIHPRCRHTLEPFVEELNDVDKYIQISNKPFKQPGKGSKEVQAYYKTQRAKQQIRGDRLQYEKYRTALGQDAPVSFNGFRKMKQANTDKYKDLKSKYREFTKSG